MTEEAMREFVGAPVVRLNREPHPNADKMFVQTMPDGKKVCGSIPSWEGKELAVYIQPDMVVDTDRPEFLWVKTPSVFRPVKEGDTRFHKVSAVTLRGVLSNGFMAEAPPGSKEGDDVMAELGVTWHEETMV